MRKLLFALGAVAAATSPALASKPFDGEAELAKLVDGRIAGKPVHCVNLRDVRSSQIVDHTAIVYDAGNIIYVNRPRAGTESLDRWDTLVTKTFSSDLCDVDVVHLYDATSRMQTGSVFLGDFVPYRRPPKSR